MGKKTDNVWKVQVLISIAILAILIGGCIGLHIFNVYNGWIGIAIIVVSIAIAFYFLRKIYKEYM